MPSPIIMPKPGQFTEECTIVKWLKKEGDAVAKGDVLFEIETDKANMEVESFYEGTLLKVLTQEGDTVPIQTTVAFVGQPGEAIPEVAPPPPPEPKAEEKPAETTAPKPAAPASAPVAQAAAPAPQAPAAAPAKPGRLKISPRARALAKRSVIDPAPVKGTGPGGRITEKDVQAYLDAKGYANLKITPAAKQLAMEEGLDLLAIRGSGEGGKIAIEDIRRAVAEKPQPMSKMRQVIAQRLTQSVVTAPHFYVTVSADMTDLIAYRSGLKAKGVNYSVTDFIMQAVVLALREQSAFNSSTDGKSTTWRSRVNLGLAVSLENGLVVPVIRNADNLTLAELRDAAKALTVKARDGKLTPDEMSGGTFTISNMGMLNVENFTAIINPGEAAILAVSSTMKQPAVRDDKLVIRSIMKMTLSSDHRLIDGAQAAQFVNAIKSKLEDVALWKGLV